MLIRQVDVGSWEAVQAGERARVKTIGRKRMGHSGNNTPKPLSDLPRVLVVYSTKGKGRNDRWELKIKCLLNVRKERGGSFFKED